MNVVYLRKDMESFQRKISIDMPYLSTYMTIRLLKSYYEDNLFYLYRDKKNLDEINKYFLKKEDKIKEDENFYYFKVPFKAEQIDIIS